MGQWLPDIAGPGIRYVRIVEALAVAIADGTLAEGAALPPQRELAHALGLSLGTVTRAYGEARRRGLVEGEHGRGTFVRRRPVGPAAEQAYYHRRDGEPQSIDLGLNLPVAGPAAERLPAALAALARDPGLAATLTAEPAVPRPHHAAAGSDWLARLGGPLPDGETLVTVGGQHALLVAFLAASRPGDLVLVEPYTFPPAKQIARHLGLRLEPVPSDDGGLRADALDRLCRTTGARLLYAMPTLQSPTAVTMGPARREAVAAVVRAHGLTVIEDDVYGHLPPSRPPPLAAFAPDAVMLVTSLSKSVAPWLRVGYLRVPPRLAAAARAAVAMTCWTPPSLGAELAARWIADGTADAMLRWQRQEVARRQELARAVLGGHAPPSGAGSLHLWVPLAPGLRPELVQAAAAARGVRLVPSGMFAVGEDRTPAIRLAIGGPPDRALLRRGLEHVADLLAGGSPEEGVV